ncbi:MULTISPECIES: hypothetical protein [unclassified Streptomyces]|uniref:hypothetical protein n=1 Tax=unclassified Streptomyces TaxID=2593676 RepID=UPI0022B7260B|nr:MULTISPECIES: hypothetical protein [unclassified Streptomyces]MCZ7416822.1 hypothetical protein [Streptomyces sp. WMMC897]MCZ7433368.1 hypothetical protein [Streptomyces sp. WMMC1477]
MSASPRRATVRLLTAVAVGALALTGCGEGRQPTDPGPVAATDTAPAGGEGSRDTPASAGTSPWAGTKQFVTIDKAWTEGGVTRLSVRVAQKKVNTRFDTWEITPGTGPFTTVALAEDARALLTAPVRGDGAPGASQAEPLPFSQAEFVTLFGQLDPRLSAGIGYDLSFDGAGRVVRLQSLYTP